MSNEQLPSAVAPVAITLAAIAASAAPSRPSGETLSEHSNRVFLGIQQQLTDSSLATGNNWSQQWLALSADNANMAYLAKSKDGSNQFAVVIRGTVASETDMLEDLDVGTVVPFTAVGSPSRPVWVSKGAMEAFTQVVTMNSVGVTLVKALANALAKAPPNPTVRVIGHSLGGCIATMVAPYLLGRSWSNATPRFALHTFAAPSAGGSDFASYVDSLPWVANERYYNTWDLVPQAWTGLAAAKNWYPDPGPEATFDVRAVIGTLAGLPGPNVYAQPGDACALNPVYGKSAPGSYDPNLTRKSLQDFMGQVAYQHANSTYLRLLGAPNVLPGPVVTSVSPNTGPTGTTVTINGTGLGIGSNNTGVDFGTLPCPRFGVSDNGTVITAYLPMGIGTGVVDVRVTTNLGTSPVVPSGRFAYDGTAPVVVTGISPVTGPKTTQVTISGENFASDAKVYFGNNAAALAQPPLSDRIVAIAPPPDTGITDPLTVNVTVLSNGYSSPASPANEFTYKL
ncbi:IPT/TIG domain-containing protein [Embleya sp. NPDC050493]|uniref:IPT/TIG domain-containing protein n=1 Tax=Embleya sp. NPDC050493 TaxID=3363989 RepID=UPI0037A4F1CB